MADEHTGGREWVVEPPPGRGEVSLYVECGEGVELTAEQETALGALLRSLEAADAEVTGHDTAACKPKSACEGLTCPKVSCTLECTILLPKVGAQPASVSSWNLMGTFSSRSG